MNIEDLVDLSADEWDKLSDKELYEICKAYFNVTRPELCTKPTTKKEEPKVYVSPQKQQALLALQEAGVDISFMRRKKK